MTYVLWVMGVGLHGQFYAVTDAYHENIFLGDLNVSGKPSEGQLTNCWICAPPLGGGDHVTPKRLTVLTRLSLGQKSSSGVLAIGRLPVIVIFVLLYICAYYTSSSSSVSSHHHSMHQTLS